MERLNFNLDFHKDEPFFIQRDIALECGSLIYDECTYVKRSESELCYWRRLFFWTNPKTKYKAQGSYVTVYGSPTSNCQLCSVANFRVMLGADVYVNEILSKNDNFNRAILMIYLYTQKKLMFIDVNKNYDEKIQNIFGKHIVIRAPYASTNGSEMIQYTINIQNYLIDQPELKEHGISKEEFKKYKNKNDSTSGSKSIRTLLG